MSRSCGHAAAFFGSLVETIQRLGARAGHREFGAADIALVGELEQRALGAGGV